MIFFFYRFFFTITIAMVMNLYKRVQIHADFFSDVQNFLLFLGGGVREIILFSKKGSVHCREFYCMYLIYI